MESKLDKHLPKTLVLALESLFCENELKSWSISSGKYFSQVTIRFTPEVDQGGNMDTKRKHTKYKRMPPSQVKRDELRASQRSEDIKQTGITNLDNNGEDIVSSNLTCHIESHIDADDYKDHQGVNKDSHNVLAMSACSQADDFDEDNANKDEDSAISDHCSKTDTSSQDSLESRVDEEVVCNICDDTVETAPVAKYHVCAQCSDSSKEGLFVVCRKCHKVGKHNDHTGQMTLFTDPEIDHGNYCSQCGYEFKSPKSPVFACSLCHEFDYEICYMCYTKGLHSKHAKYIQQVTRDDIEARHAAS